MILLLLLLWAFSATTEVQGVVKMTFDISKCPITFYGVTTNKIYVMIFNWGTVHCMGRYHPPGSPTEEDRCFRVRKKTGATSATLTENLTKMPKYMLTELKLFKVEPTPLTCMFKIEYNTGHVFHYANLGDRSVLHIDGDYSSEISTIWYSTFVGDNIIERDRFSYGEPREWSRIFFLTGCKASYSVTFWPVKWTNQCQKFRYCRWKTLVKKYKCSSTQICDGRGSCVDPPKMKCSAFANSVINEKGQHGLVDDSCSYVLLSDRPRIWVLGRYGYRRRTDLPFLDSVFIKLGNTEVQLLGGLEATVNNRKVQLSGSGESFGPVTLSKNSSEVRAVTEDVSIMFDGTSCLISFPSILWKYSGLCNRKRAPIKNFRNMVMSKKGCQTRHRPPQDPTISCSSMRKKCETYFNGSLSAQFRKVCGDNLCKYGDVDHLSCGIQNSYFLLTGQGHADPSCATPSPCLNHTCAPHEFCGETRNGKPQCVCREDFMKPFRENQKYVGITQCDLDTASVELPVCLLADKGYDPAELRLLDQNCTGEINDTNRMVKFWFSHDKPCGARITSNDSTILYENVVIAHDPENNVVTYEDLVFMNFSCSLKKEDSSVMTIRVLDNSVFHTFDLGEFEYTVTQKLCSDPACFKIMTRKQMMGLGTRVYVHLNVDNLDSRLTLRIKSCWGSTKQDGGGVTHYLVKDCCSNPSNSRVQMTENGESDHCSFDFRMFRFIGHPGVVHMTCEVELCLKDENDENSCRPRCDQIHRAAGAAGTGGRGGGAGAGGGGGLAAGGGGGLAVGGGGKGGLAAGAAPLAASRRRLPVAVPVFPRG